MVDIGISILVNSLLSSPPFNGGFFATLPKGQSLPNWTYRSITDKPDTTLTTARGLAMRRLQIDVYGATAGDAITMAESIDQILHGYHGTLPDADVTWVGSCFRSDIEDFFDTAARTYRRMLEYEILYAN